MVTLTSTTKKSVFIVLLLVASFVLGIIFDRSNIRLLRPQPLATVDHQIRQSTFVTSSYQFIDPLIGCDESEKKSSIEFAPLKEKINNFINSQISTAQIDSASVYFDKRDGSWLSINPNEKYFPASLMKVPTMIAVLKVAESDGALLTKKIVYDGSFDLNAIEHFKPAKNLVPHQAYTVDDLLFRMIGYSDNNAVPLLVNSIDTKILNEVFTDLGITIPQEENATLTDYITVKQYASFFRVLYNATYLNREMSEKALYLLSQPDFPAGIMAGMPAGTKFVDKFGERNFGDNPNDLTSQKELHDCGIVYYPDHPYLLCIMTKGTDFEKLANAIKNISKIVYDYNSATAQAK